MRIAIASIDEAYALSSRLDDRWFKAAKEFSDSRKRTFLAGRALLQRLIAQDKPTFKLPEIINDTQGKPVFSEQTYPHFNISHSGNLIAVALGDSEQGIDIERIRPRHSMSDLIKRVLSDREQNFIKKLDDHARLDSFIMFWTLRECLLKVSGRGLGGLQDLSIDPDEKSVVYPAINISGHTVSIKTAELLKAFDLKQELPCWMTVFVPDDDTYSLQVLIDGELCDVKQELYCNNGQIFAVATSFQNV